MPDDDLAQFELGIKLTRQLVSSWLPNAKPQSKTLPKIIKDRPSGLGLGANAEIASKANFLCHAILLLFLASFVLLTE